MNPADLHCGYDGIYFGGHQVAYFERRTPVQPRRLVPMLDTLDPDTLERLRRALHTQPPHLSQETHIALLRHHLDRHLEELQP